MKVVLIQHIQGYGRKGEVKDVKDGYALNCLLPQGKAVQATEKNVKKYSKLVEKEKVQKQVMSEEPNVLAKKLRGVVLDFAEKADESGNFFAGVTKDKIAKALVAKGLVVKSKQVKLDEAIKKEGQYPVKVEVAPGVESEIKVVTKVTA
jgi:large subunit ribosomal protein L9